MLNDLRAEQIQKQKKLQLGKESKPRTKEIGIQFYGRVLGKTIDASTQTSSTDILTELKEQVQSLKKIVKELTALKRNLKATTPLISEEFSDDETLGSLLGDAIRTICQEGESSDDIVLESPTLESSQALPSLENNCQFKSPLSNECRLI